MKPQNSSSSENKERFSEILSILRKNHIGHGITPEKLKQLFEDLGPTFIKLGQILSMRSDILPEQYCQELSRLRAEARPLPTKTVLGIIQRELDSSAEDLFLSFDKVPLGSASIAQVHAAQLKNGERVVVKVQRPGIRETMEQDISLLKKASGVINKVAIKGVVDLSSVLDEIWQVAKEEMDFQLEAQNLHKFTELNKEVAYVACPKVYDHLTTKQVLVMEYIDGISIAETDTLKALGYSTDEIAEKLSENFVKQIIDDRFFHADPHPGNIYIREGKIVWIDLGMMGHITDHEAELFKKAVRAVAEFDIDTLLDVVMSLGEFSEPIDKDKLYEDINHLLHKYGTASIQSLNLGKMLQEFMDLAKDNHVSLPRGLSMYMRSLITIEGVVASLSSSINIMTIVANHISGLSLDKELWKKALARFSKQLYYSVQKSLTLPGDFSDLVHKLLKGKVHINLEYSASERVREDEQRCTERLIYAMLSAFLLLGSCIIYAAMLLSALERFPYEAVILFLIGTLLGIVALFKV